MDLPIPVGPSSTRTEERIREVRVVRRVTVRHYPGALIGQFMQALYDAKTTGSVTLTLNLSQGSMTSFDAEEADK